MGERGAMATEVWVRLLKAVCFGGLGFLIPHSVRNDRGRGVRNDRENCRVMFGMVAF